MTRYQGFKLMCRNLQCTNVNMKDVAAAIHEADKNDLQELLELLISTHNIELQAKLFSILAAYLINNGVNNELIVKYHPLYESIQNLLVRGLPMKAASALHFVMALLGSDDGDSRSLATHAQNMIRVSGCLNTMVDMFSGSMMYQDTWIALCQSLAEACRGSELNQSYCSHLVPLCVQRCRQGSVDVCAILQSLLHNHDRNLQLFIKSEGLAIFTRQMLQYNMGMQLLNTVVARSPVAASALRTTDIIYHLRNFLHLYGPYTQMGQWSTIILYHLDKGETTNMETSRRLPVLEEANHKNIRQVEMRPENIVPNCSNRNDAQAYNRSEVVSNIGQVNGRAHRTNHQPEDDTATLFQNVIKEVIYWKSKENGNFQKASNSKPRAEYCKKVPQVIEPQIIVKKQNRTMNRTFSSLMKDTLQPSTQYSFTHNDYEYTKNNAILNNRRVQPNKSAFYDTGIDNVTNMGLETFKPAFVSTPKRNKNRKINISKISHRSRASTMFSRKQMNSTACKSKRIGNTQQDSAIVRDVRHRSMTERLFNAINESCTTIVKGIGNIFRTKQDTTKNKNTKREETTFENASCSFSFTNYMRRRDSLLENEFSPNEDSSSDIYKVNSCKTCKDTIVLQQKLERDDHLRQTVRKLKMGINLYGCDFKKISRAVWPHDRYMTPDMLYSLYRKLIVKGGHGNHQFRQKAYNASKRR